jgi:hypothetical protein
MRAKKSRKTTGAPETADRGGGRSDHVTRRHALWLGALALVGAAAIGWSVGSDAAATEITVYKSPWCGCCEKWMDHLRSNGFDVAIKSVKDLDVIKNQFGVMPRFQSCHTATVEGYVIEGHVPAADIRRLLSEKPQARGLAVPGMPTGSPGMEGPDPEPYNVMIFDAAGRSRVYSAH